MSQDNPKRVVRFDHNYENRSPIHEISEDIANGLKDLEKNLEVKLQIMNLSM